MLGRRALLRKGQDEKRKDGESREEEKIEGIDDDLQRDRAVKSRRTRKYADMSFLQSRRVSKQRGDTKGGRENRTGEDNNMVRYADLKTRLGCNWVL